MKPEILLVPAAAALAAAAAVFLVAPEKPKKDLTRPFSGRNFAHRGLYKRDGSIPENSLPAFAAAAQAGYGVELDVHLTADDEVVVFHDDDLSRMCGVSGRIEDMFMCELDTMRLLDTGCRIPRLSEVFEALDGAPVILEIKRALRRDELCCRVLDLIDGYKGDVCVESFDPMIVCWFRKHAPDLLRGQLSCRQDRFGGEVSRPTAFALSNLLLNCVARPNFIAWGIGKKPPTVRMCEAMGAMKVAWTSHSTYNEAGNDAVIFEFYTPGVRFK